MVYRYISYHPASQWASGGLAVCGIASVVDWLLYYPVVNRTYALYLLIKLFTIKISRNLPNTPNTHFRAEHPV